MGSERGARKGGLGKGAREGGFGKTVRADQATAEESLSARGSLNCTFSEVTVISSMVKS